MRKEPSPLRTSIYLISIILLGLVLLSCLAGGIFYNSLVFRHQRAFQLWEANKPGHYRYLLAFKGALTYQDYLVEVSGGSLIRLTDMNTGISVNLPAAAPISSLTTNTWINSSLLIDHLFIHIRRAVQTPNSVNALVSRTNPALYTRLSDAGWVTSGLATCVPAYPQVRYNSVYGYPEDLQLSGDPCSSIAESSTSRHIQISDFQPLP